MSNFWNISTPNRPQNIIIPPKEIIYNIDLESRLISGPETIGCLEDHEADTFYFSVDRYYDGKDLADTIPIIQYKTVNKNTGETYQGVYPIPLISTDYSSYEDKIILPWTIRRAITQTATDISYNFRFFEILNFPKDKENLYNELEKGLSNDYEIVYNLNTLTTTAQVQNTISAEGLSRIDNENERLNSTTLEEVLDAVKQVGRWQQTNWVILD